MFPTKTRGTTAIVTATTTVTYRRAAFPHIIVARDILRRTNLIIISSNNICTHLNIGRSTIICNPTHVVASPFYPCLKLVRPLSHQKDSFQIPNPDSFPSVETPQFRQMNLMEDRLEWKDAALKWKVAALR